MAEYGEGDLVETVEWIFDKVTRVEVIDSTGRAFVQYYEPGGAFFDLQDAGRTLKLFAGVPLDFEMRER